MRELLKQPDISVDEYYLMLAFKAALLSPDPSTQNGALLLSDEDFIIACNDFPEEVVKNLERLERPMKYHYIEHAERNVIYRAAKEGKNLRLYHTMYACWFSCSDCARAIIQTGIKRVVGSKRLLDNSPDRWKDSIKSAFEMFSEAGIKTELVDTQLYCEPIRFDGRPFYP